MPASSFGQFYKPNSPEDQFDVPKHECALGHEGPDHLTCEHQFQLEVS